MKIHNLISILILVTAASLGWRNHQQVAVVRMNYEKLVANSARSGISGSFTRKKRADRQVVVASLVSDFANFLTESHGRRSEDTAKLNFDLMSRLASLDVTQLKIFIDQIDSNQYLANEGKRYPIGLALTALAELDPRAAMEKLIIFLPILKNTPEGPQIVASALNTWCRSDGGGALDWVLNTEKQFPDLVGESSRRNMIRTTAFKDPELAFKMIGQLRLFDSWDGVSSIINSASNNDQRNEIFAAFRKYLEAIQDPTERNRIENEGITFLIRTAAKEGFDSGIKWITDRNFSSGELDQIMGGGLMFDARPEERGKWVEWAFEKLSANKAENGIKAMIADWIRIDHRAVGVWLNTAPQGPMRDASVEAFAGVVSKYEPKTAEKWALTLPVGEERDDTLRNIYENWPKEDPAAAEDFAKRHGIR